MKTKNPKSQVTYVAALLRRFKRFDTIDAEHYNIANLSAVVWKVKARFPHWKIETRKIRFSNQNRQSPVICSEVNAGRSKRVSFMNSLNTNKRTINQTSTHYEN